MTTTKTILRNNIRKIGGKYGYELSAHCVSEILAELEARPAAPDLAELLSHLSDVIDDENWAKIDTKLWNSVSKLTVVSPAAPVVAEGLTRYSPTADVCQNEALADMEEDNAMGQYVKLADVLSLLAAHPVAGSPADTCTFCDGAGGWGVGEDAEQCTACIAPAAAPMPASEAPYHTTCGEDGEYELRNAEGKQVGTINFYEDAKRIVAATAAPVPASEAASLPVGEVVENANGTWGVLFKGCNLKAGAKLFAAPAAPSQASEVASVPYAVALTAMETVRGNAASTIEDHAKDTYPGLVGMRPQDVAGMWAAEVHDIDTKAFLDEAIADARLAAPAAPTDAKVDAGRLTATHGPLNLTNRKTADIASRGYNIVGYVLRREDGEEVCISAESAVRWLPQAHYWRLMHEQDGALFATPPSVRDAQPGDAK